MVSGVWCLDVCGVPCVDAGVWWCPVCGVPCVGVLCVDSGVWGLVCWTLCVRPCVWWLVCRVWCVGTGVWDNSKSQLPLWGSAGRGASLFEIVRLTVHSTPHHTTASHFISLFITQMTTLASVPAITVFPPPCSLPPSPDEWRLHAESSKKDILTVCLSYEQFHRLRRQYGGKTAASPINNWGRVHSAFRAWATRKGFAAHDYPQQWPVYRISSSARTYDDGSASSSDELYDPSPSCSSCLSLRAELAEPCGSCHRLREQLKELKQPQSILTELWHCERSVYHFFDDGLKEGEEKASPLFDVFYNVVRHHPCDDKPGYMHALRKEISKETHTQKRRDLLEELEMRMKEYSSPPFPHDLIRRAWESRYGTEEECGELKDENVALQREITTLRKMAVEYEEKKAVYERVSRKRKAVDTSDENVRRLQDRVKELERELREKTPEEEVVTHPITPTEIAQQRTSLARFLAPANTIPID